MNSPSIMLTPKISKDINNFNLINIQLDRIVESLTNITISGKNSINFLHSNCKGLKIHTFCLKTQLNELRNSIYTLKDNFFSIFLQFSDQLLSIQKNNNAVYENEVKINDELVAKNKLLLNKLDQPQKEFNDSDNNSISKIKRKRKLNNKDMDDFMMECKNLKILLTNIKNEHLSLQNIMHKTINESANMFEKIINIILNYQNNTKVLQNKLSENNSQKEVIERANHLLFISNANLMDQLNNLSEQHTEDQCKYNLLVNQLNNISSEMVTNIRYKQLLNERVSLYQNENNELKEQVQILHLENTRLSDLVSSQNEQLYQSKCEIECLKTSSSAFSLSNINDSILQNSREPSLTSLSLYC